MSTHKSRWGYHPISFEAFEKLRKLQARYWASASALARWTRWERKTVHQVGPEPKCCPVFVLHQSWTEKYKNREGFDAVRYHERKLVDHGIIESLRVARMPAETPESVKSIPLTEEAIDRLYEEVERWFSEQRSAPSQPGT